MSNDSWDSMRKAKELEYFEKKNKEALERLKEKQQVSKPRPSPITGEPMEQVVFHGVVIDRCKASGGIWLDAGELEQIIEHSSQEDSATNWLNQFFKGISGKG